MDVVLIAAVITEKHGTFYMHRRQTLPVLFPGLIILRCVCSQVRGSDWSEDRVESVSIDVYSNTVYALVEAHDFRRQKSGGDWSIDDVLEVFDDWICTQQWPEFSEDRLQTPRYNPRSRYPSSPDRT